LWSGRYAKPIITRANLLGLRRVSLDVILPKRTEAGPYSAYIQVQYGQ
jgi:hypothetical protein